MELESSIFSSLSNSKIPEIIVIAGLEIVSLIIAAFRDKSSKKKKKLYRPKSCWTYHILTPKSLTKFWKTF